MKSSFFLLEDIMIETKRLILRPYSKDDIDDLYKRISDKETMKYFDQPYTYEQTIRWVNWSIDHYNQYGFSFFAVILFIIVFYSAVNFTFWKNNTV